MYKIYNDTTLVGETEEQSYTVTGLEPDTEYSLGVSKVLNGLESEAIYTTVTTLPEQTEIEVLTETYDDLTVAEIKELLDDEGIEYTSNMRKSELLELLQDVL